MPTMLQKAAYHVVHEKLSDPQWVEILMNCVKLFENDFFPGWYTSIFFQSDPIQNPFSIYDAYGFAYLHTELTIGKIVYGVLHLGNKPSSDRHQIEMNKKLQSLCPPFKGQFWGGNRSEDGEIIVDHPIELSITTKDNNVVVKSVVGRFPLEIGVTSVFKTFTHLATGAKRLARWPYGSEDIYLLARV